MRLLRVYLSVDKTLAFINTTYWSPCCILTLINTLCKKTLTGTGYQFLTIHNSSVMYSVTQVFMTKKKILRAPLELDCQETKLFVKHCTIIPLGKLCQRQSIDLLCYYVFFRTLLKKKTGNIVLGLNQ